MKKIVLSLLVLATILVSLPQLFAAPGDKGNVVVHFKAWDEDYTDLGSWGWGHNNWTSKATFDGEDEFGVYFEFNDLDEVAGSNTETYGFIAVPGVDLANNNADWNAKKTSDILIPKTIVKGGETVHVYVFQGDPSDNGKSTEENPRYFVADNANYNMLLVYFDPSGAYEENLGVHNWDGWTESATEWGVPLQVFSTGGNTATGSAVKVGMLHAAPVAADAAPDAGLLIYAGGDPNKKTGDVKLLDALGSGTHAPGDVGFAYVVSKGDAYTAGDNVYYGNDNYEEFALEAFSFRLNGFSIDSGTGQPQGTFAVRPNQIIVKTSAQVTNLYAVAETEQEQTAAMATMTAWFEVREKLTAGFGPALTIERVDFALRNATVSDFVIVLAENSALNTDKEYVLFFDDGTNEADIDVDMDTDAPIISFPLLGDDKIILVQWGQPFDLNDFPLYSALDDRDGDLTRKVFVPAGANAILNTGIEADYTIMLQVEDNWGNVTQETFIFRVTKNPQA